MGAFGEISAINSRLFLHLKHTSSNPKSVQNTLFLPPFSSSKGFRERETSNLHIFFILAPNCYLDTHRVKPIIYTTRDKIIIANRSVDINLNEGSTRQHCLDTIISTNW
ncbi:unnamed protein product [Cuscuta epithymum]|uniref:Uncharacterized protein n=1 Tax=Cuscuta epithymum TaxID=186058 RepID=A0AAV0DBA3_9ASTE|nr:unnamed protein product [Cuscuta epithymum]